MRVLKRKGVPGDERTVTDGKASHESTALCRGAVWAARIAVAVVFVVNVQCALGFVVDPGTYASAFEQHGAAGYAAMQGLGVAFLMWNATYPPAIVDPVKHGALFAVVLVQQAIGLVGETVIAATLPAGHDVLAESIQRFIAFDAFGLVIMGATFTVLLVTMRRNNVSHV